MSSACMSVMLYIVGKWYMLQQQVNRKSLPPGTRLYNFQPPHTDPVGTAKNVDTS